MTEMEVGGKETPLGWGKDPGMQTEEMTSVGRDKRKAEGNFVGLKGKKLEARIEVQEWDARTLTELYDGLDKPGDILGSQRLCTVSAWMSMEASDTTSWEEKLWV